MSFNILDLVKDQLGAEFAKQAGGALGIPEAVTDKAMGALLPSVLGSMADLGTNKSGVEGLLGAIGDLDGGLLDNIGGALGGGSNSISTISKLGGPILSLLLGNKSAALGSLIGNFAGLKGGMGASLLKLAAPFILNIVGKKIKGMGAGAIMDLFKGQKANINAGLPSGFDLNSLGAGNVAEKATAAASKGGNGLMKWLIPILLLAGLAYYFGFNPAKKAVEVAESAVETTVDAASSVAEGAVDLAKGAVSLTGDALKGVFEVVDEAAKATLDGITFVAGSAGDQMKRFIEGGFDGDNKFTFSNLTFATGSSDITAETAIEVDNIAAILKAYPNVKVAVEGYTDNTGDANANVTLSQKRAESVRARLASQGVSAERISTAGFGDANPVGDNSTPEGRAQNRRIELRIVQ